MQSLTQHYTPAGEARRVQESLLAPLERPVLHWLAARMPKVVNSDHLTLLGLGSMFLAGVYYALAGMWPPALFLASACLAVNWFGDSLDGTLARYRNCQRPRYGFYVDHIVDAFSALFMLGGLALSGYMHPGIAGGMLVCFLMLAVDSYLAAHTLGVFQISIGKFSPTEMRILLAIGNTWAFYHPIVKFWGEERRFFDVAGLVAIPCMLGFLLFSVIRNTWKLYHLETR